MSNSIIDRTGSLSSWLFANGHIDESVEAAILSFSAISNIENKGLGISPGYDIQKLDLGYFLYILKLENLDADDKQVVGPAGQPIFNWYVGTTKNPYVRWSDHIHAIQFTDRGAQAASGMFSKDTPKDKARKDLSRLIDKIGYSKFKKYFFERIIDRKSGRVNNGEVLALLRDDGESVLASKGALWAAKHKPIEVVHAEEISHKYIHDDKITDSELNSKLLKLESKWTQRLTSKFGRKNVRGGRWTGLATDDGGYKGSEVRWDEEGNPLAVSGEFARGISDSEPYAKALSARFKERTLGIDNSRDDRELLRILKTKEYKPKGAHEKGALAISFYDALGLVPNQELAKVLNLPESRVRRLDRLKSKQITRPESAPAALLAPDVEEGAVPNPVSDHPQDPHHGRAKIYNRSFVIRKLTDMRYQNPDSEFDGELLICLLDKVDIDEIALAASIPTRYIRALWLSAPYQRASELGLGFERLRDSVCSE